MGFNGLRGSLGGCPARLSRTGMGRGGYMDRSEGKSGLDLWVGFVANLPWVKGQLDASSYHAFLRAASCGVDAGRAFQEVCNRLAGGGAAMNAGLERKTRQQLERAFSFVGSAAGQVRDVTWRPTKAARQAMQRADGGEAPAARAGAAAFDAHRLEQFAGTWAARVSAQMLGERSTLDPAAMTVEQFLDGLYEDGEKCVVFTEFKSQGQWVYERGAGWLEYFTRSKGSVGFPRPHGLPQPFGGKEGVWYLCQPVDGRFHPNPRTGRTSRRSEESVTAWRFLVLESDEANAYSWLGAMVKLPLPIVAIYTSGGKSVHVLLRLDARTKGEWDMLRDRLRGLLVPLGADPGAMTAVRLSRLPFCRRGGKRQRLLFFDPVPRAVSIIDRDRRDRIEEWIFLGNQAVNERDREAAARALVGLEHYGAERSVAAVRDEVRALLDGRVA